MDTNTKQYKKEIEKKLYKYLLEEDQKNDKSREYIKEQKKRVKNTIVANQSIPSSSKESAGLALETYVPSLYTVQNVILDSSFSSYPNNSKNKFLLELSDPLKNVYAIRILRTDFVNTTNSNPIYNAYLYLNGYINTILANGLNTRIYTKLFNNTNIYPSVSSDITMDPYIYIFKPIDSILNKFNIQIMNADGTLYDFGENSINLTITLAVYTIPNLAR
jgi:3-isopropylmalate dehydratase small subunit